MARLACASLVKYCGGWFPFYSAVTICECHFSVTARYVKKKLPSLGEVRNDTVWRTFERLGYSYKARRRKAAGRRTPFTTALSLVFTNHQLCSSDQKHVELCCWIRFNEPIWCRVCNLGPRHPAAGHVRRWSLVASRPLHHSSRAFHHG